MRQRIVTGKILKITTGEHNMFAGDNIAFTSGGTITQIGRKKGVSFNPPQRPATVTVMKKFLVHFSRPSDYQGEYGFDWLREEYIYPLVNVTHDNQSNAISAATTALSRNIGTLKQEYLRDVKNPVMPHGVTYYPAWLSIFPSTTTAQFAHGSTMHRNGVSLDLRFDELETMIADGTEIQLECPNSAVRISPASFGIGEVLSAGKKSRTINGKTINYYSLSKKVNIKCEGAALPQHEEVKVFAKLRNQRVEVGKLMLYKNNVIPKAEIVVVNVISDPVNRATLRSDYQFLFKHQSFNQALIRAEVSVDTAFDLVALNGNADVRTFLTNQNTYNASRIRDEIETLYNKYGRYKVPGGINGSGNKRTYLFCTTISAGNTLGICSLQQNVWGNMYVIFNSGLLHDHTIVHECGHSLSLPHVFQEGNLARHSFYHGYTDNYMDYTWQQGQRISGIVYSSGQNKFDGKMFSFFKWQWDIMRTDRSLITNY